MVFFYLLNLLIFLFPFFSILSISYDIIIQTFFMVIYIIIISPTHDDITYEGKKKEK